METIGTIVAPATAPGGALAVIRVSGSEAIALCDGIFRGPGGTLSAARGYTLHYGEIVNGRAVVDQVVVSLFRTPRSYTGEDMVEISCHASPYILQQIIQLLIAAGARIAAPGEFTVRAFLAGKIDLVQAEAVADLIASTGRADHAMAANQLRGGYSAEFSALRGELVRLVSLLELELDFGEEDVTFADRAELAGLLAQITEKVSVLLDSFALGNAVKQGVGVAIVGSPNVGKSTLLNALLKEERALVSEIPGTTRDVIEEALNIDGIPFRFIDTAGIRATDDALEKMGIERTFSSISRARIILLTVDAGEIGAGASKAIRESAVRQAVRDALEKITPSEDQKMGIILNKIDKNRGETGEWESLTATLKAETGYPVVAVSAKEGTGLGALTLFLAESVAVEPLYNGSTVISNVRHHEALRHAKKSLECAMQGLQNNISADLLAQDVREVLHYIGTITGEITNDEILGAIFSGFCIGK